MKLSSILTATLAATVMLSGTASADPVTIRTGWVVATSGYTPLQLGRTC
jgi:hypothetical protein